MPSVFQSLQDMDEQRVKMIQVKFNLLIAFSIFNNNHFKYTVPIIKTAHPELQNVLDCFLATLYLQSGHLKFKQSQMVCKRTCKLECCLSQKKPLNNLPLLITIKYCLDFYAQVSTDRTRCYTNYWTVS